MTPLNTIAAVFDLKVDKFEIQEIEPLIRELDMKMKRFEDISTCLRTCIIQAETAVSRGNIPNGNSQWNNRDINLNDEIKM